MQKSDDELNAVCLCPGRDHHINIARIQRSVCCMLISATLPLSHIVYYCETEVREGRQLKAVWILPVDCHSRTPTLDGCFMHFPAVLCILCMPKAIMFTFSYSLFDRESNECSKETVCIRTGCVRSQNAN